MSRRGNLSEYMTKKKEDEKKAIERKENTGENRESPLFTFVSPKKGETVTFKLRILPSIVDGNVDIDGLFFIEQMQHKGFWDNETKRNGLKMKCPAMFDEKCPICHSDGKGTKAMIAKAWDTNKALHKQLKKSTTFIMNVLVLENSTKPELEGLVKRLYVSKEVHENILDAIYDEDDPKALYDWEKGFEVKFTIKLKDNGFNSWGFKVLKKHDMSKSNIKPEDIESLDALYSMFKENTLEYVEYHNAVVDIISNNAHLIQGQTDLSLNKKGDTKVEDVKPKEDDIDDKDFDKFIDEV